MMAVYSAAINQTPVTAAPNILFSMRRCLNGRKVACIRSKEIATRLVTEAAGKKYAKLEKTFEISNLQKEQSLPNTKSLTIKLYGTNMFATARLITRYMLPLRRIRSFRNIRIAKVFMVTIETASMLSTVSKAIHSDEEMGTKFGVTVLFW